MTLRHLSLICLLLVLACSSGNETVRSEEDRPTFSAASKRQVIFILLDAARPDRFSCYGYSRPTTPEMDRLASRGVVFQNHFAQATGTRESIPSLLYSRYFTPPLFAADPQVPYAAPGELFRRPDREQISLPMAFQEAGFVTAAIVAHLWMGEKTAFADEFQELRDLTKEFSSKKYPYPRAREVVDDAMAWIDRHRDRDYFLYIHMMDTHYPHYLEKEAQELLGAKTYSSGHFSSSGSQIAPTESLTTQDLDYVDALYDGSLRYADGHLGRLFQHLRTSGILEQTTIAITSDHGEYLRDGKDNRPRANKTVFSHGGAAFDPVARIPLILVSPARLTPGSFQGFTAGVDLGPTLLELAGAPPPAGKTFDGRNLIPLLSDSHEDRDQVVMARTIRTSTHKLILASRNEDILGPVAPEPSAIRGRLFDLLADPWEVDDISASHPDIVADLVQRYRQVLGEHWERAQRARSSEQPTAGFAISARYANTEVDVPRLRGGAVPSGWSLVLGEPHSVLSARDTNEPLDVSFPLPNGTYQLSFGVAGQASVATAEETKDIISSRNMAGFGPVVVTDESFRISITPRGDLRVFFFGFVPAAAEKDAAAAADRREKLKALGYVE